MIRIYLSSEKYRLIRTVLLSLRGSCATIGSGQMMLLILDVVVNEINQTIYSVFSFGDA